jgi:hypothetical protein
MAEEIRDIFGKPVGTDENLGQVTLTGSFGTVNATIKNIWGKVYSDPPHDLLSYMYNRPKDYLAVWLEPSQPIGNVIAFGIELTSKDYTRDELLAAIAREGSHHAQESYDSYLIDKINRVEEDQRKRDIEKQADGLKALLK